MQPKRAGNCGWYFKFLNWLSENGLSLDVCGRLWERVTPRSASSSAVALAFIGAPRSACSVSWPYGTWCFAIASSSNGLNRAALSASADPELVEQFVKEIFLRVIIQITGKIRV